MKLYLTRIACLLSLVLTACAHNDQAKNQPPLAPPIEDAPLPKPDTAPKDLPPTVVTQPKPATTANTQPQDQPKPPVKHKKPKPAPANTTQTASADPAKAGVSPVTPPANQDPANPDETTGVSAIGKLSSGGPADAKTDTENSLNSTEHTLNGISRKLSDQEEKTKAQIQEYIKQARAALESNDLDGAKNLATKAKLLLNELTTQ
jgi:outer membrane biosynthesis protein TonB